MSSVRLEAPSRLHAFALNRAPLAQDSTSHIPLGDALGVWPFRTLHGGEGHALSGIPPCVPPLATRVYDGSKDYGEAHRARTAPNDLDILHSVGIRARSAANCQAVGEHSESPRPMSRPAVRSARRRRHLLKLPTATSSCVTRISG